MLEKRLNVGDHVIDAKGNVFFIQKVNQKSYTARQVDTSFYTVNIDFSGMGNYGGEYSECQDPEGHILSLQRKTIEKQKETISKLKEESSRFKRLQNNLEWLMGNSIEDSLAEIRDEIAGGK